MSAVIFRSMPARAIIQRIAESHHLDGDTIRSRSRRPHIVRARTACYIALRDEKQFSFAQIANLFGVSRESVWQVYQRAKQRTPVKSDTSQEYIAALEAQLRRLTGVEIVHQIGQRLSIPPWCAVFLSVLVEAYPRHLTTEQMCELYDEAAARLNHGNGDPVGPSMSRSFVSLIGREFAAKGLPNPVHKQKPHGWRLSDDIAPWMSAQFGRPVLCEKAV